MIGCTVALDVPAAALTVPNAQPDVRVLFFLFPCVLFVIFSQLSESQAVYDVAVTSVAHKNGLPTKITATARVVPSEPVRCYLACVFAVC